MTIRENVKKVVPESVIETYVKAKNTKREYQLKFRKYSWDKRVLPDFIIIGAMKSGTTSLYNYLGQHPQIVPAFKKEIHFFDGGLNPEIDNYKKGEAWYRAHFPKKRKLGANQFTFEATPLYLFNPLVPKRIHKLIPDVKLIVLLRNPVERAISHYYLSIRAKWEVLPMIEAFKKEEERLANILEKEDYKNQEFILSTYKSRGLYKNQIKNYLKYFNRNQLKIISSEDFFKNPRNVLKEIFEFIGVDKLVDIKDLAAKNVTKNSSQVDPEVYDYLEDYFRIPNRQLYKMLSRDFNW